MVQYWLSEWSIPPWRSGSPGPPPCENGVSKIVFAECVPPPPPLVCRTFGGSPLSRNTTGHWKHWITTQGWVVSFPAASYPRFNCRKKQTIIHKTNQFNESIPVYSWWFFLQVNTVEPRLTEVMWAGLTSDTRNSDNTEFKVKRDT